MHRIVYILLGLIDSFTISVMCICSLNLKKEVSKILLIIFLGVLLFTEVNLFAIVFLNHGHTFYFLMITMIAFFKIFSKNSNAEIFLFSILPFTIASFVNYMSIFLVSLSINKKTYEVFFSENYLEAVLFLSKLLFVIVAFFIIHEKRKVSVFDQTQLIFLTILMILSNEVFIYLEPAIYYGIFNTKAMFMVMILVVTMCIVILIMAYKGQLEYQEKIQKSSIYEQMDQLDYKYQEIKEKEEILSEIRHDIKNKNAILREYINQNNLDLALKFLDNEQELTKKSITVIQTGNRIIDSVINSKMARAHNAFIQIEFAIRRIDILDETAFDIAIILSNILDNAIENIYENDRRISIKIRQTKYFLDIVVVNTTGINVLKKNPMLFTTKMDKNDHGLGIRSVRRYVSKLNGTIHFSQEGHEFKSWVSIPCENILD